MERWRQRARQLKLESYALYLAYRDPRVPWHAKLLAAVVLAYALSPLDLIPDFIPVLGYLDDLILVPLGIALAIRLIPRPVMDECREQASLDLNQDRPTNWLAGVIILGFWLACITLIVWQAIRVFTR